MKIRLERPEDYRAVEMLTRESFWNIYSPGCTEHFVLHCYRNNPDYKRKGYGLRLLQFALERARNGKMRFHPHGRNRDR